METSASATRDPRLFSAHPEPRHPLHQISDAKVNSHLGSIHSGAVRVPRKEKSPKKTPIKSQHRSENHYMQATESSRSNSVSIHPSVSTPKRPVGVNHPGSPHLTPSRSKSPSKHLISEVQYITPRRKGDLSGTSQRQTPSRFLSSPSENFPCPIPGESPLSRNGARNVTPNRSETKASSKMRSHSKGEKDVFSRLTQGLPTRHTAPPSSFNVNLRRSQSTGKLRSKSKSPRRSSSRERNALFAPGSEKLSSKTYHQVSTLPPKSLMNEFNSEKDLRVQSNTLVSHLLLPSPPRNFVSCIPEPPPMEQNSGIQSLQHLRDLIQKENIFAHDVSADSELTNTPESSPLRVDRGPPTEIKSQVLFPSEVSVVEESESRSSSPRSLLSASTWTIISEPRPLLEIGDVRTQSKGLESRFFALPSDKTSRSVPFVSSLHYNPIATSTSVVGESWSSNFPLDPLNTTFLRGDSLSFQPDQEIPFSPTHQSIGSMGDLCVSQDLTGEILSTHDSLSLYPNQTTRLVTENDRLPLDISLCVTPTSRQSSSILEKSFYLSHSQSIGNEKNFPSEENSKTELSTKVQRRDSGIMSEVSSDSAFLLSEAINDSIRDEDRTRLEPVGHLLHRLEQFE